MPDVVSRDGFRIHFEASGDGAPVVLLHPVHATRRAWIELGWFEQLRSRGFRAVALDARGFGDSDPVTAPEHLSPGAASDDVAAVLDVLGVGSAHLCGFSLGAAAAARFAVDQPERVASLVLGGLALGPLAQLGLALGCAPEDAREQALAQLARVRHESPRDAAYFGAVRGVLSTASLRDLAAADLRSPMLGVAGEADPNHPFALYERLRVAGARIQVERIPGVAHGACFPHAEFRRTALDFLVASRSER